MSVAAHRLRRLDQVDAAGFSPTSISGLQLWLDADDVSTFTFGTGTAVSQWNDKSGNSRHVVQATGAQQPDRSATYGARTAVRFTASNSNVLRPGASATVNQPITLFAVAARSSGSGSANARIIASFSGTGFQLLIGEGALGSLYAGTAFVTQGSAPSAGVLHQISAIANGASSQVWGNGTAGTAGNAGSNSLALSTVGASGNNTNYLQGDIAEVIVYDSALGTTDRQAVETYLKSKWGTP